MQYRPKWQRLQGRHPRRRSEYQPKGAWTLTTAEVGKRRLTNHCKGAKKSVRMLEDCRSKQRDTYARLVAADAADPAAPVTMVNPSPPMLVTTPAPLVASVKPSPPADVTIVKTLPPTAKYTVSMRPAFMVVCRPLTCNLGKDALCTTRNYGPDALSTARNYSPNALCAGSYDADY